MAYHAGQIYQSTRPLAVTCMTSWAAPCTGGHHAEFPAGEQFKIGYEPPPQATSACADPLNYRKIQKLMVSWKDRWHPLYAGYYLSIPFTEIDSGCRLVPDEEK